MPPLSFNDVFSQRLVVGVSASVSVQLIESLATLCEMRVSELLEALLRSAI